MKKNVGKAFLCSILFALTLMQVALAEPYPKGIEQRLIDKVAISSEASMDLERDAETTGTQVLSSSIERSSINRLTESILRKENELLKLNSRFRVESTKVSKWKPWRLFAYGLAGNVVTNIGIDHICYARWKYWQRPALATKPFLRKGPICLLIGHSIIGGGVLIESALDAINDRKTKNRGFDRRTCRQRVITIRDEISDLLDERARAVSSASLDSSELAVLKAEEQVLKDVKNCALDEFVGLSARAAKWKTARNTTNIMNFGNAATGGFIGSLGNLLAVSNRKPRIALPAGVGFITSGSFITLNAPTTRLLSTFLAKREAKKERALTGILEGAPQSFDGDRERLAALLSTSSAGTEVDNVRRRMPIYKLQDEALELNANLSRAEKRSADKEYLEKMLVGAVAGGTKIAWGTNLVVAGSAWSNKAPARAPTVPVVVGRQTFRAPVRTFKTPAQLFSKRVAQGATCQVVGSGIAALDVLQSRIRGELRVRDAKSKGHSAGQIMSTRISKLEEIERLLAH